MKKDERDCRFIGIQSVVPNFKKIGASRSKSFLEARRRRDFVSRKESRKRWREGVRDNEIIYTMD